MKEVLLVDRLEPLTYLALWIDVAERAQRAVREDLICGRLDG